MKTERAIGPVVIAGGGTGGHIFPGLALAKELARRRPDRPLLWIGARGGLEEKLVVQAGVPLTVLPMTGIARAGLLGVLRGVGLAVIATARCAASFVRRRPALLVGVGGFASGPAVLAAAMLGVPTLLLEQNAVVGRTNLWLSFVSRATAASFEANRAQLHGRVVVTGNPIREEIGAIGARPETGTPRVLGFGGSRGASALNRAWLAAMPALAQAPAEFVIQTGPNDYEQLHREAPANFRVAEFLHDMPAQLAASDLVVSRAGATTVAELAAAGRASVLIPFPFAANDHQTANARELAASGAALMIRQEQLTAPRLAQTVLELLADRARLSRMANAARGLGRPDATLRVADLAEELLGEVR
jgi:UDP-N-acetylglucosamine--N-acetylmuramyl-(pentapeptide) pyrophosphoryl-undecaprenol N-acetylglucosamine transferase